MDWSQTKEALKAFTPKTFGTTSKDADLRGINFQYANLAGADLFKTDLRGSDFTGADLRLADMGEADLRGAQLQGVNLEKADLRGAKLHGCDLRYANLHWADLRDTGLFTFTAGRDTGYYIPWNNHLIIGCAAASLDWWLANYKAEALAAGYTQEEIARYGAILHLIEELYPQPAPEPTRVKTRAVLLGVSATTARKSCDVMNKSTRYDGLNFRPAWNPPDGYMILVTGASIPAGIEAYVSGVTDALLAKLPTSEGERRYPAGIYTGGFDRADEDMWRVCTCTPQCQTPCKGQCGCEACLAAYNDYLMDS